MLRDEIAGGARAEVFASANMEHPQALIGRREQGQALARNAEDTVKAITQRIGGVPPKRSPRVYYARRPRGLETGLGGSINVETIELLAQNVAGGTRSGLANASIEQVLLWNPDADAAQIDRVLAGRD